MDAIDCLKTRRSIRIFEDKDVPEEIVDDILDCARKAPSGHNSQAWKFVVVRNKDNKDQLAKAQKWSSFIADAPICIVVCCTESEHRPSNYLSAACAAQNILLSAHAHGLGGCWCYVKDFDDLSIESRVRDILIIPKNIEVLCMIPIGYPDEKPGERVLKDLSEIMQKQ